MDLQSGCRWRGKRFRLGLPRHRWAEYVLQHGTNPNFGAVGHFGAGPDIGCNGNISTGRWTFIAYTYDRATLTQTVYRDGQLANSETNLLLNIALVDTSNNPLPFRVATQNDAGGTPTVGLRGSLTIARIRVYDEALTAADILANYNAELPTFGVAPPELKIGVDRTTGTVTITWNAQPGKTYTVKSSSDPTSPLNTWTTRGTGLTGTFVDDQTSGAAMRFYVVQVE